MKLELELTPEQIRLLQEGIDELPLNRYISLVSAILPQLPLIDPPTRPAPLATLETAGGVKLSAYTPRGVSLLTALDSVLCKLPHGGSL